MDRFLTKSRFKLALECPTKLFYTKKPKEYNDTKLSDIFLIALAEGGFQVGELAKMYYSGGVNIDELDHIKSIEITDQYLRETDVIIYEGAFCYENLFVRADIVTKKGRHINLIEVKAKSIDPSSESFLNSKNFIATKWAPYLYDIAFQKYVIQRAKPDFIISSYLMLADKSKRATVNGLNQKFLIYEESGRIHVSTNGDVKTEHLGDQILTSINVDEIIDRIYGGTDRPEKPANSFEDLIKSYSYYYENDKKFGSSLGAKCGKCEFKNSAAQNSEGLKSGFQECWQEFGRLANKDFKSPSILDLWDFRRKDEYISKGVYYLEQLKRNDLESKVTKKSMIVGLSRIDRQELQVKKAIEKDDTHYIDLDGLRGVMRLCKFPLHFIDFETTSVAIPFNIYRKPYEQIAFQFSHHVITSKGEIEHKGQWINSDQGLFPNFEFVRALKSQLENDAGSIFRFAAHENTILNCIYVQLQESEEADKLELCNWIKTITHSKSDSTESWKGERDMIDLREWVLKYYYNPATKGSNSLKYVLPAIIKSSEYLKNKYSQPIYGNTIPSLNFKEHRWIIVDEQNEVIDNPYETLPTIHDGISNDQLDNIMTDEDAGIFDGGAAMMAYAKIQFTEMTKEERQRIIAALLRYCELDTFAMVMIWEAWNNWCS